MRLVTLTTLGLILLPLCHGFFPYLDDLYESLTSAREFFDDSMLPKMKDLYSKLKRVHDVTDALIDEECQFNDCQIKGQVAVHRKGHTKTSNGCGALNLIFDDSDNSPVRYVLSIIINGFNI